MGPDRRQVLRVDRLAAASVADSTILGSCIIPTNKEIEIYNLRALIRTSGAAGSKFKLTDSAGNTLADVAASATNLGYVAEATQTATAPVKLTVSTGNGGGDTCIHLKNSGNIETFVGTVQADFSYPGAK